MILWDMFSSSEPSGSSDLSSSSSTGLPELCLMLWDSVSAKLVAELRFSGLCDILWIARMEQVYAQTQDGK